MKKLTDKLFQDFWRIDGVRFRASMVDSSESNAPRMMLMKNPCFVNPGETIKNGHEEVFLLLQYPTIRAGYKTFRAIQATETFDWVRRVDEIDPVSQMSKSESLSNMGKLYGTYQNIGSDKFQGYEVSKKRFWTGQDVRLEDIIEGCPVIAIEESLGAKLVTIR